MSDSAGVATRGSHSEKRFALDDDDVADTPFGEMISDAGSHASAPDDDHVCRVLHMRQITGARCEVPPDTCHLTPAINPTWKAVRIIERTTK